VLCRSDANNLSGTDVWELKLDSQGVEDFTGGVSKLELVGVFVHLEDGENFSEDIEVSGGSSCLGKFSEFVLDGTVVVVEVG